MATPNLLFDPGRIFPNAPVRDSDGGEGSASFGAVLKQGNDGSKGLFIYGDKTDPSWHLRGVERQIEEAAVRARLRYSNAAEDAHVDVVFGRTDEDRARWNDFLNIGREPEWLNTAGVSYWQHPNPAPLAASHEVNSRLTIRAKLAGVPGNSLYLLLREGQAAVAGVAPVARLQGTPQTGSARNAVFVTFPQDAAHNGIEIVLGPRQSTAAVAASAQLNVAFGLTGRWRLPLTYSPAGTGGNNATVTLQYDSSVPAGTVVATYTNATTLVVGGNDTAGARTTLGEIADAINAARFNGNQHFVAGALTATSGNTPTRSQAVQLRNTFVSRTATLTGGVAAGTEAAGTATWDATARRLRVGIDHGTTLASAVIAGINAVSAFPGTATLVGAANDKMTNQTQTASGGVTPVVGTTVDVHEDTVTPSPGVNATRLVITGVVPDETTIADAIASYNRLAEASRDYEFVGTPTDFVLTAAESRGNNHNHIAATALQGGRAALTREDTQVRYTGNKAFQVRFYGSNSPAQYRSTLQELHDAWEDIRQGNGFASPAHVTQPVATITGTATEVVDVDALPTGPSGGSNYIPPSPIEFLLRPEDEADGKNIEVRYHADHDTLQEIIDASLVKATNPGEVKVIELFGTDLTEEPEEPPFSRRMYPEGGTGQADTFTPSKTNLYDAIKRIFHPTTNPGVTADDENSELDVPASAPGGGLTAEEVRDTVADFVRDGRGIGVTHDDGADTLTITLNASSESNIGGVRNVSTDEAAAPEGTVFRAWSSAMITKVIAVWRTVVTQAEAVAGTATVARFWTAQRVRQAITAVVPAVFRSGNTTRFPAAKMGSGTADTTRFLRGDRTWAAPPGATGGLNQAAVDARINALRPANRELPDTSSATEDVYPVWDDSADAWVLRPLPTGGGGTPPTSGDFYFGTSDDGVPTAGELTVASSNGVGVIAGYAGAKRVLIARLASEADLSSITRSDDVSGTNQLGAFTKYGSTVSKGGNDFEVWVSNQALTQAANVTWTAR